MKIMQEEAYPTELYMEKWYITDRTASESPVT